MARRKNRSLAWFTVWIFSKLPSEATNPMFHDTSRDRSDAVMQFLEGRKDFSFSSVHAAAFFVTAIGRGGAGQGRFYSLCSKTALRPNRKPLISIQDKVQTLSRIPRTYEYEN